jgi:hypothetical protein
MGWSRYRHAGANGERRYSSYSLLTSAMDGVVPLPPCRRKWGEKYRSYSLLTSVIEVWFASRSGRALPLGKDPRTHWIGGWVDLTTGLDTKPEEKSFASCGYRTPVVQSVVRHYSDASS